MTMILKDAFDGAEMVRFAKDRPVCIAWFGGTTFNVYAVNPGNVSLAGEVDMFSVSDEKGRPVDRVTAEEHIEDYFDRLE